MAEQKIYVTPFYNNKTGKVVENYYSLFGIQNNNKFLSNYLRSFKCYYFAMLLDCHVTMKKTGGWIVSRDSKLCIDELLKLLDSHYSIDYYV